MAETANEVVQEIFDQAADDGDVGDLAQPLLELWDQARWTVEKIGRPVHESQATS